MFESSIKSILRSALVGACAIVLAVGLAAIAPNGPAWADDETAAEGSPSAQLETGGLDEAVPHDDGAIEESQDASDGQLPDADGESAVDGESLAEPAEASADVFSQDEAGESDDTAELDADEADGSFQLEAEVAAESAEAEAPATESVWSEAALATQDTLAIADGSYTIKTTSVFGQALGNKSSYSANAAIQSYAIDGAYDQLFYFQQAASGLYSIFSVHSGLALTVSSGKVVQAAYSGSDAQLFEVRSVGGFFALVSKAGTVTASAGGETKAQSYAGSASQKFRLVEAPTVLPGVQVMRTATDTGKAVRAKDGSASAEVDAQVANYSSDGTYNLLVQRSGEYYAVRPVSSGFYLAASGSSIKQVSKATTWKVKFSTGGSRRGVMLVNQAESSAMGVSGSSLGMAAYAPSAAQSFLLAKSALMSSGYYNIAAANGLLVDVADGSFASGANIQVHANNGSGAQVFYFEDIGGGVYVIRSSRSFKVLDVRYAGTAESTNVWQYYQNLSGAQLWVPVVDSSGRMVLMNANSGKVLTMAGTNVRINSSNGSAEQHWTLVPTGQYSLTGNDELDHVLADILSTHTTLKSAFDYVSYNFSYRSGNKHWSGWSLSDATSKEYALDMYRNGSGNCYRFASLFAWCARGLGYTDVVVRTGWVVGYTTAQAPHGWVTINGYVCDPDMQHEASSRNWYWQTYASAPTAYYSW